MLKRSTVISRLISLAFCCIKLLLFALFSYKTIIDELIRIEEDRKRSDIGIKLTGLEVCRSAQVELGST